jgi:hypothetical protein
MPTLTVADLLNAGRLEHVPADRTAALTRLQVAETHLVTAAALVGVDNDVAYTALYDAARKAIVAHMLANGLRAPARMGAHEAVGIYAKESIPDPAGSMTQFQQMRRRRNKSEYDNLLLGRQDVETDLRHATNIVAAVRADLAP